MIRPKIVASTATVRRAERQIRALFCRRTVDIFPPPGPDRHLEPGDVVTCWIEGIGELTTTIA